MFWHGDIPGIKLRFVQFLYYKGLIDWQTMIDALVWQKRTRPRVGEIGMYFKFLHPQHIGHILQSRQHGEKFCEVASRIEMLSPFQCSAILGKQIKFQRPIGMYFIEQSIFSRMKLEGLLSEFFEHNRLHG